MWWGYMRCVTQEWRDEITKTISEERMAKISASVDIVGEELNRLEISDKEAYPFMKQLTHMAVWSESRIIKELESQLQRAFPTIHIQLLRSEYLYIGSEITSGITLKQLRESCNERELRGAIKWLKLGSGDDDPALFKFNLK